MPDNGNLDFLLMVKKLMIVHFACHESVGTSLNGIWQKERSCPAADGYTANLTPEQLVGLHTLHVERALEHNDEIIGGLRFHERTDDTRRIVNDFLTAGSSVLSHAAEEMDVRKFHLLGNFEVHATHGIIHIGVHCYNGNAVLQSFDDTTLHVVLIRDVCQFMKNERVMSHNKVAT